MSSLIDHDHRGHRNDRSEPIQLRILVDVVGTPSHERRADVGHARSYTFVCRMDRAAAQTANSALERSVAGRPGLLRHACNGSGLRRPCVLLSLSGCRPLHRTFSLSN